MATKYLALLTNIGAAKLAKATALGTKVEITQLAVGDGNGVLPTPNPAQTALVHELRRAPLNMLTVDPANASQIIAEQVIPEDVGGWWIREIGLFDKDGDMVAIANCAETYKPQLQEGSGRVQVIRVILIVSSTEAVTLKIDPAVVLATRQYVDSQLRAHEQSRNHPDASTTEKGFVQLSSSVTSDSESQAATSKAVKIAMDNGSARLAKDRNLSDLPNTALARQNLELGDSSTRNVGTTAGTVASGDDARITGAMQKNQNGADIPDVAKFLQNLRLGAFISSPSTEPGNFSQVNSPDGKSYLFIANNKNWGAQTEDGKAIPLSLERGGSGAGTPEGAREAFGLGNSATKNIGTTAGTVAAGDDSRLVNLKSAANRSVGNSANQIPDMSYFTTGETSAGRWAKLPSGLIIQAGFGLTGSAGTATVNLPIPFTGTFFVVGGSIEGNGPIFVSARGLTQSTIGVVAWGRDGSIQVTNMHWLAIGV
ncbi:phage tail protein [Citrobacter freundii]|uniref:phage tail protein n=1 Tax=Citrobacter freundii TaxID=546 RepID=UPI00388EB150